MSMQKINTMEVGSIRFCLICNTKIKSKRESYKLNSETISTLSALWEVPLRESANSYEDLLTCVTCHRSLRRITTFFKQFVTLRRVLQELKSKIEISLSSALIKTSGSLSKSSDEEKVDQRIQTLRNLIMEGKRKSYERFDLYIRRASYSQDASKVPSTTSTVNDTIEVNNSVVPEGKELPITEYINSRNNSDNQNPDKDIHSDSLEMLTDEDTSPLCPTITDRLKCSKVDCRFTFKDEIGREAHVKKYHEGNVYSFTCDICEKAFQTRRQLKIHIMGHNGEFRFICEKCGQGFRMERLLNDHLKTIHKSGTLNYKCSFCSKCFLSRSKLSTHESIHTKLYPYLCSTCGKGFRNSSCLKLHTKVHQSDSELKCRECEKTFTTKKAMESHKSFHTGVFKVSCTLCSWGGPSQAALTKHMFKHTDQSNFECSVCCKKFKFPNTLKKHLKIHSNQKNYKCNTCDKSFIDSYKLNRHQQIHDGKRPHECPSCQKRFLTKDALKVHSKKHFRVPEPVTTPVEASTTNPPEPPSSDLDLLLTQVNCPLGHSYDIEKNAVSFTESSEIPLSQIFDSCEFIPCNVSHVPQTSLKMTNLPDLSSTDIFPGEIFPATYSQL